MSKTRRSNSSAAGSSYGPPSDIGMEDKETISRFSYDYEPTGSAGRMGPTFSVGKVGMEVPSAVFPGQVAGTGVGVRGRMAFKKGGAVKKMAKGGSTASKRADGIARKGKTRGKVC